MSKTWSGLQESWDVALEALMTVLATSQGLNILNTKNLMQRQPGFKANQNW